MTHSTENVELENQGNKDVAYHEINVTSLDVAGEEGYDPSSELNLEGEDRFGIGIRGQTNATIDWGYDTASGNLTARRVNASITGSDFTEGTEDVPAGADVGHVTLEVVGD